MLLLGGSAGGAPPRPLRDWCLGRHVLTSPPQETSAIYRSGVQAVFAICLISARAKSEVLRTRSPSTKGPGRGGEEARSPCVEARPLSRHSHISPPGAAFHGDKPGLKQAGNIVENHNARKVEPELLCRGRTLTSNLNVRRRSFNAGASHGVCYAVAGCC